MTRHLAAAAVATHDDVSLEVETVADAVRIGRDAAQKMIATAALIAFGPRTSAEIEIHLFTVETVSELTTAPVPRPITVPDGKE